MIARSVGIVRLGHRVFGVARGRPWLVIGRRLSVTRAVPASAAPPLSDALQYERKTPREHILLRPDTYIGSTTPSEEVLWLYDETERSMEHVLCTTSPGLVKIFDEILVNAADNKQRDASMTELRVEVDRDSGSISVFNNGRGLPIEIHPKEGVYVPTLIFGSLFTSSNYDDQTIKTVGGRNGYGAKLCNIYSTEFSVETVDSKQGLELRQTWFDNMESCTDPMVSPSTAGDYTKISFRPDLSKFGLSSLDEWTERVFRRRTIDVAGTLSGVEVYFNGERVEVSSFRDYVSLYSSDFLFLNLSRRWQVAIARSPEEFRHVSFVNNIATSKGGKHVDYVVDQIVAILKAAVAERSKNNRVPRSNMIREHLFLFVNSLIENPSFDSQTKDRLITRTRDFGSTVTIGRDPVVEWAERSGLIDSIVQELDNKRASTSTRKIRKLGIVPKLEDANLAGTVNGHECTLLVTEGDSAKALAVAGLEVIGRDRYGVFPIRGKMINVSDMASQKARQNVEIANLVLILGLQFGETYSDPVVRRKLRYGQLMILADQDEDGSHIKGLLLNLFRCYWPQLLDDGFLMSFRTPLIKARRGGEVHSFYSYEEFSQWKNGMGDIAKYSLKYYKGLGTSTSSEARSYFSEMSRHVVRFSSDGEGDRDRLAMAFDKERAGERKQWIAGRGRSSSSDCSSVIRPETMSLSKFVDEELIEFSLLDLKRSIPSVVDGLKPSQRKVLHTLLQRNEKREIKVNQLAGAVSMQQAYHHGEESLVNTIVRMAQDYVGSNNVPLLKAVGQFGTRHEGGADAASARYIHTRLSPIARSLFPAADDPLLEYRTEENMVIEPNWYCPIVPLVLVNGAEGIGTGWATRILSHNIDDVIRNIRRMIEGLVPENMLPWWRGFTGSVTSSESNRYEMRGICRSSVEKRHTRIDITELPVGVWTSKYKERVLTPLVVDGTISDVKEFHTEHSVNFRLLLRNAAGSNGRRLAAVIKRLKMTSQTSANSMVLFDETGVLKRYDSTLDILSEHFDVRRRLYEKRLEYSKRVLEAQTKFTANQMRFVKSFIDGSISMHSRPLREIEAELLNDGFKPDPVARLRGQSGSLSYLFDMPLARLTSEEVVKLSERLSRRETEWQTASRLSWQDAWLADLDDLRQGLVSLERRK